MALEDKIIPITLDLTERSVIPRITLISQSINTNFLLFTLTNEYEPIDLTGAIFQIAYKKEDKTVVINRSDETNSPITITDSVNGIVNVKVTTQAMAYPGKVDVEVSIEDTDEKSIFPKFNLKVVGNIDTDQATLSTNEIPVLMDKINQTNTAIATANTATNTINTTNTNISVWEQYNNTKQYVPLNKVAYMGRSYINIQACTGVLPNVTTNWLMIADKGADGLSSMNFSTYSVVSSGIKHIPTSLLAYNPIHDIMKIYYCGDFGRWLLTKSKDYTENADNISIDLIMDSPDIGESFEFEVFKNVK